jgi:hypothetical protein
MTCESTLRGNPETEKGKDTCKDATLATFKQLAETSFVFCYVERSSVFALDRLGEF